MASALACNPDALDDFEYFEPVSASDPSVSRLFPLPINGNSGGDPLLLPTISANMGSVRYSISGQRRPFLFQYDLRAGLLNGSFLHLPQEGASEVFHQETLADPTKWHSFRVYDVGLCSIPALWDTFASKFVAGFERSFQSSSAVTGGALQSATLTPMIKAGGRAGVVGLGGNQDELILDMTLHADNLDLSGGTGFFGFFADVFDADCSDVTFDVHLEFSEQVSPVALISVPPIGTRVPVGWPVNECVPGSTGIGFQVTSDDTTRDFVGVVHAVDVSVRGCGVSNGRVAGAFSDSLAETLPESVRSGVQDALLFDPRTLGIPPSQVRECACDQQCWIFAPNGPAYAGLRHRCVNRDPQNGPMGECWVQLEPDRIHARPEMLEIVFIDSLDDPQAELVYTDYDGDGVPGAGRGTPGQPLTGQIMCNVARNFPDTIVNAGAVPVQGTLDDVFPLVVR